MTYCTYSNAIQFRRLQSEGNYINRRVNLISVCTYKTILGQNEIYNYKCVWCNMQQIVKISPKTHIFIKETRKLTESRRAPPTGESYKCLIHDAYR